jgi:hypothetical protein
MSDDTPVRKFDTGSQRDGTPDRGVPSLRPMHALNRLDRHMEAGAKKYDARNWEKGQPLSVLADSAYRHLDKFIAGYDDEDHLAAALWNVAALAETVDRIRLGVLPSGLDDLPHTMKGKTPDF